jgi:hypothetical protein
LDVFAYTRSQLRQQFHGDFFYVLCNHCNYRDQYEVGEVSAESNSNSTITGSIVGGLVGLIGGPIGFVIGGSIGGLLGNNVDGDEKSRVEFFNNSR